MISTPVRLLAILAVFGIVLGATSDGQKSISLSFDRIKVYPQSHESVMGFAWADINNDDWPDLVTQEGGYGGPLLWYESQNEGTEWARHLITTVGPDYIHFCTGDLEIGDIDGDGDTDVLGMQHPGEWTFNYSGDEVHTDLFWYENSNDGSSWEPHKIGRAPDFVKDVEVVDLNDDGRQDIVISTYRDDFTFAVFRQDADGKFTKVTTFVNQNLHEGMDNGDIDGDGDPDVVLNGYWVENPGGDLTGEWTLRNIAEKWHNQSGDWRKNATKVFVADMDGDGRAEPVISHSERSGYPVAWYDTETPEASDSWQEHVIISGLTAVHTLEVGDLDNDGNLDVLVGENGDHDAPGDNDLNEVRVLLNQGQNHEWEAVDITNDGLYNGRLVDANRDGRLDIAGPHGHQVDPYWIWFNQGM